MDTNYIHKQKQTELADHHAEPKGPRYYVKAAQG